MKLIVLYRLALMAGMLVMMTSMAGQKPTIDLLPSSHQYKHPEAMIDTTLYTDTLVQVLPPGQPQFLYRDSLEKKTQKKEFLNFGLSIDSIFQKKETKIKYHGVDSGRFPLILKLFNPIKLFIHITAIK